MQSENRYGQARFAETHEVSAAGLFDPRGLYLGHMGDRSICINSDSPILTLGGSGCGKLATVLGYNLCLSPEKIAFLDPKGEGCAISMDNQVRFRKPVFPYNPYKLHGLPAFTMNPTGFIRKDALTLTADLKTLFEDLISTSGADGSAFFENTARGAAEMFGRDDVETHGTLSLPRVYEAITTMIGGGAAWQSLARDIAGRSPMCMGKLKELINLQQGSARTFGVVAAELTNAFAWLSDPAIMGSLSDNPDIELERFVRSREPGNLMIIIPADLLGVNAPLLRLIFSAMMIIKGRDPEAPRLNLIVDEAGQLGKAPFLQRAFSFGRGVGIKTWAVFQDAGQISKHYGPSGVQSFMANAEVRQFLGANEPDTAGLISKMLGNQTIRYVDEHRAQEARLAKRRALQELLYDTDEAFEAILDAQHYRANIEIEAQTGRPLLDISEIISMSNSAQILFVTARDCPPIYCERTPYWLNPRLMAGHFFPNPYHPPRDAVMLPGRWGRMHQAAVVSEPVPSAFAGLPQYRNGRWRYIKGYRP